jgi:ABC-type transport system involved in multi-copper enzyme maturation permease subunit
MSDFALTVFSTFAIVQGVVVLLLTPALVGGAIADERQRKTLHYLLTSQLSGVEIVLGKLAAKMLQVVVLVALGLPVVSLIGLFGGIDFKLLLLTYAGTFTTIYFLSTASILISVHSRRPREAISVIYVLEAAWLLGPPLILAWMPLWGPGWRQVHDLVEPVGRWVAMTSPIYLLTGTSIITATRAGLEELVLVALAVQVAWGTLFATLAALSVRSAAREDRGRRKWTSWLGGLTRRRRWLPRPDCGDNGMIWKELHVARTGGLTKTAVAFVATIALGFLAWGTFELFMPAYTEMMNEGYFINQGWARRNFNAFIRGASGVIYVIYALGVASGAASGITSEREEDQWLTLTSTPMTASDILPAKMLGPIWGMRPLLLVMFGLWGLGIVVGSISPVGLAAALLELCVFTWFITAFGVFVSLRSKNSTRSLATTVFVLAILNGGYLFCCIPFRPDSAVIVAGCTPFLFGASLVGYDELWGGRGAGPGSSDVFAASVLGVIAYGAAAFGFTGGAYQAFDVLVDRPDRLRQNRPAGEGIRWVDDKIKPMNNQLE